jgi:hypothetical protein
MKLHDAEHQAVITACGSAIGLGRHDIQHSRHRICDFCYAASLKPIAAMFLSQHALKDESLILS